MRHDSGLAASPPVRDTLEVERSGVLSFRAVTDKPFPKRGGALRVRDRRGGSRDAPMLIAESARV